MTFQRMSKYEIYSAFMYEEQSLGTVWVVDERDIHDNVTDIRIKMR